MTEPEFLLNRLTSIGDSLATRETALALIGLGSVGLEFERLDRFSDLDFFVIVKAGNKAHYLTDLSWLTDIAPVAYAFMNTKDGYKLLYEDGVFCEFAVFEEAELEQVPFAPGRVVWRAAGVAESISVPKPPSREAQDEQSTDWHLGEALTNLYVGLLREHRGERLTAMRFIQGYAVDRILALAEQLRPATNALPDPFNRERRFEFRYPDMAPLLPAMLQGYERNRESALAALAFLDEHFEINAAMKTAIRRLCDSELVSAA
jgi:hypothetical protein